ncbi:MULTISPECIES: curli assembly protein CsgF [unclassified Bradyrhizobium]|uniref:curli assembly protein CsgF n=1 Tax=unclassified Bradyrhizobium TaxID=2631580 RepID=UPI0028E61F9D|nr:MULTISPECIES: curli assembly protein CsgF [unclassified Bradyrhizobium]
MRKFGLFVFAIASAIGIGLSAAAASEIVYHPTNPTFGGSGLNGSYLLSQAQAQGHGVKSGSQGPDLSGLNSALSNLGSGAVIIGGNGTGTGTSGSGTGSGTTTSPSAVRSIVP